MLLRNPLRWGFSCAAALAVLAVVWTGSQPEPALRAQLFRQAGEGRSVELATGDAINPGDELFMTVEPRRALHVYVVSEDAAGERWIIYPCRTWGRGPRLTADRQHRLPAREGFWPVRSVTSRERLLVIASARPVAALDAAFLAMADPQPCAAAVDAAASRWLDRLIDPPTGLLQHRAHILGRQPEAWVSTFELEGARSHG